MSHPVSAPAPAPSGRQRHAADRAPRATHPVLLMNPRSGGGKATRFRLGDRCRDLGVEPVVLGPGDDLVALAEAAVARGSDLLGMAGGDGSQALVATVAARHGIPFVVVPAGTRNHFARDLGVGTGVVGSLSAFVDGVDVRVDLAEVNGRVFVNNASMGAYAELVRSPRYREAKVRTAVELLPELVGPSAVPVDLRYALPGGERGDDGPGAARVEQPLRPVRLTRTARAVRGWTAACWASCRCASRAVRRPISWPRSTRPGQRAVPRVARVGDDAARRRLRTAHRPGRGRRGRHSRGPTALRDPAGRAGRPGRAGAVRRGVDAAAVGGPRDLRRSPRCRGWCPAEESDVSERVDGGPVPAASGSMAGGRESVEDWLARAARRRRPGRAARGVAPRPARARPVGPARVRGGGRAVDAAARRADAARVTGCRPLQALARDRGGPRRASAGRPSGGPPHWRVWRRSVRRPSW